MPIEKIQSNNELLKLFKEKFNSKSFLKGRLLNGTKRGFSIGVAGVCRLFVYETIQ